MNAIYGQVTTSNIKEDGTYVINVESNISDLEYRNCDFVQQPGFNTFPKVGDTVLLLVVGQGQYAIIGVVAYTAKQYMALTGDDIKLIGNTITANGEDLTTDLTG